MLAVPDVDVLPPLPDMLWLLPEFELAADPDDVVLDGTLVPVLLPAPLLVPAPVPLPPPDALACPPTVDGPTPVINR